MTDQNYQKFIEELKSRNGIVDVVSAYCQLTRRGGSYWARCPLPGHMEKTASFCVNEAGQFFKCFGCQRGGDVITFIMEVESLSYMEAVRFLANRVGLEVPSFSSYEEDKRLKEKSDSREVKLAILKESAKFYVNNLSLPEGAPYLDYIYSRGFDANIIRTFGLGCSFSRKALPKYLHDKGFNYDDMVSAGVVSRVSGTDEYVDFEANRMIVPIIDGFSKVIAFGGRVIEKTDFAKYKNTCETGVFIKNRAIFNANNIKKLKREQGTISSLILVEGYMDVIALHAAGFKNAVASMGTSLTAEQARIIARYTDTVIVSYDGDAAGQKATARAIGILSGVGLTVKVVALPDNLDPDEFIKARGKDAYADMLSGALPALDFRLVSLKNRYDINDATSRRRFIDEALKTIADSDMEYEREELLRKLSSLTNITYESLRRDLDAKIQKSADKPVKPPKSAATEKDFNEVNALHLAERFILYAVISKQDYAKVDDISDMDFSSGLRADIAEKIISLGLSGKDYSAQVLAELLGEDYLAELASILDTGEEIYCVGGYERYFADCKKYIMRVALETDLDYLEKACGEETDVQKQLKIISLIQQKTNALHQLKSEDKK